MLLHTWGIVDAWRDKCAADLLKVDMCNTSCTFNISMHPMLQHFSACLPECFSVEGFRNPDVPRAFWVMGIFGHSLREKLHCAD
jgi:hypothetical protein